jgi:hypothetical protein
MRVGSAAHCKVLEPDVFVLRHPIFEGKSRRGRAWDEFVLDHQDAEPDEILSLTEYTRVEGIVQAVEQDDRAMGYINSGVREATLTWTDPESQLPCKARPDVLGGRTQVDFKTINSRDFGPSRFDSLVVRRGTNVQAALYLDGALANGFEVCRVVLIAAESEPPHDLAIYHLSEDLIDHGRHQYKRALQGIAECRASGHWPGVDGGKEIELGVPDWAQEVKL